MSAALPRLGVIILNYNTRDLLRRCLQSVYRSATLTADHLAVEVLVIDSASSDESATMVAVEFPETHLIASPVNLGYTGGNNLGLQTFGFAVAGEQRAAGNPQSLASTLTSPDYVLLLNADTEVNEDALWQMARTLATNPSAGACGAHLHYGDGSFQHGAFRYPNLAQIALDFFPLTGLPGVHRLHNSAINGRYSQELWRGARPFPVDFVLGAALMVRSAVIHQLGGLDDGYFLYCEELDWAVRMKLAGWQLYAVPLARVTHYEGQSSKQVRWSAFVRLWRSRLRFYRKYQGLHPPGYLIAVELLVALGLRWRIWQVDRRFARGHIDGSAWTDEREAYTDVRRLLFQ